MVSYLYRRPVLPLGAMSSIQMSRCIQLNLVLGVEKPMLLLLLMGGIYVVVHVVVNQSYIASPTDNNRLVASPTYRGQRTRAGGYAV